MSIQDFRSQLAVTGNNDPLMASLRRLSAVEDVRNIVDKKIVPLSDWGVWDTSSK
jgi:hypothetical protein